VAVRGGLGFAGIANNVISEKDEQGQNAEGTVTGTGFAGEISVVGAVSSNWMLGAGLWNTLVFSSNYTPVQGPDIPAGLQRPQSLSMLGFAADWHFARRLGLFAQGALGVAMLSSQHLDDDGRLDGSDEAFGIGLTLALGKEWLTSDHWAFGSLARLGLAGLTEDNASQTYFHGVVTPSLVFTGSYSE
jgi:hypothetical protein